MQDIWKLKKIKKIKNIAFGQGLFTLTEMAKTTWRLLHGKRKEQVRLLKYIRTVCCLANFVYSLFNGERFRW